MGLGFGLRVQRLRGLRASGLSHLSGPDVDSCSLNPKP